MSTREKMAMDAADRLTFSNDIPGGTEASVREKSAAHMGFLAGFAAGAKQMRERCATESESWWELFNDPDPALRRAANPNQIAARIRHLPLDGGSEGT